MIKTHLLLLFSCLITSCLLSNCSSSTTSKTNTNSPKDTLIQIPTEWIKKLRAMKTFENPPGEMVQEFRGFLYPNDSIFNDFKYSKPYINPLFVNLDESPEDELLLLIGSELTRFFNVIKKIDDRWYLLCESFAGGWHSSPNLKIENASPDKKVFYLNYLQGHGSAFHRESLNIFRIENNQAWVNDQFVSTSWNSMGYLLSHYVVASDIFFTNLTGLSITYKYGFTLGRGCNKYLKDTTRLWKDTLLFDQPFLEGEESFYFKWDTIKKQYALKNTQQQKKFDVLTKPITIAKFCKVFKSELDTL